MRSKTLAAILAFAAGTAIVLSVWPAEAAKKQRRLAVEQPTRTIYYTASGRRVVIVHRRSYLDAGTEVMPGERKYTDYVFAPNYSATGVIDHTSGAGCCFPRPGPFEPGYMGGFGYGYR